ncbi:MAG: YybS family protein [Calditerrivibrio sp.]|nr:YybS family protein [Calditerrivibrio sp.]MCA1932604.1 YybS family protein [Calditerrivibrio sp.]MCA1980309.1 YybS family protein [Calditerrivibrio sp.]
MNSLAFLLVAFFLYSLNIFIPQIAFLTNIFIPVFFLLFLDSNLTSKDDKLKYAILIVSFLLLGMYSYRIAFNIFFMAALPAIFVYQRYRKNKINLEPIIFAPIPALVITVVIITFFSEQREFFLKYILKNIEQISNSLKDIPGDEMSARLRYIINNKEHVALLSLYLMPSISYLYISFMAMVTKKVYIIKNREQEVPFKVPFYFVWFFIIGGFTFLSNVLEIKAISYNTFIIFIYLYFIQGSNLITVILIKKRLIWLRMVILFLLLIHPYVIIAIALVGLFDNWFDFGGTNKNVDES